jgi:hypothetical protein
MAFVLFVLKTRHSFGLIVSEDGSNNTSMIAVMVLDKLGEGWRVENMPSLKFKDTKLLQIDNGNIQHEILVIDKKYLDDVLYDFT